MTKPEKTPAEKVAAYDAMMSGASRGGQVKGPCKARPRSQCQRAARIRWGRKLAARTAAAVERARARAMKRANHLWDRADKRAAKRAAVEGVAQ
jgi:hypothetical protein